MKKTVYKKAAGWKVKLTTTNEDIMDPCGWNS